MNIRTLVCLAGVLTIACDEAPAPKERHGGVSAARFAVISSNYSSTSISLLDADGSLLADDYLNSGSAAAGLVTVLSGDVELPTAADDPGVLVVIDRYKTDVITRIRLADGAVLGQVKTHTPPNQGTRNAYSSNPHDYLRLDEHTAWVSRNQPNLDPSIAAIDRGNDLLRIDPSTMRRSAERIDLSALGGKATRRDPDTGQDEEVEVFARPSRLVRAGQLLVVGLGRSAFDFSAYGRGMVALVNLETKQVAGLELPGLFGCTSVSPIPGSDSDVLVGCLGIHDRPRATAGVAVLHVEDGAASITRQLRLADHPELPELAGGFVALSETTIVGASYRYGGTVPSVFGTLDLESVTFSELLSIPGGRGTFGTPCYDPERGLLLVPDASVDGDRRPTAGIHVLQQSETGFVEVSLTRVAERTAMPVRQVVAL